MGMFKKLDPRFPNDDLNDYLLELNRRIALAMAAAGDGLSTCLYVDPAGNDATAARGSLSLKYKTIQAAVDAAHAGDLVVVAPGTYAEAVTVPPDAVIGIQGAGRELSSIEPPAGDAIYFAPSGDNGFMLAGFRCNGDVRIDPAGLAFSEFGSTRSWSISDLLMDNGFSVRVRAAYRGVIDNVYSRQGFGGVFVSECEELRIQNCRCIRTIVAWTPGAVPPQVISGRRTDMIGCVNGFVDVTGLANLHGTGCNIDFELNAYTVQDGPASQNVGGFRMVGCSLPVVKLRPVITDALFLNLFFIDCCSVEVLDANNDGAGPNRPRVKVGSSTIRGNGISAVIGGTGMEIDLRGSVVPSQLISQGGVPFTEFWVSEYDVSAVVGPVVVNGPTPVNLPIRFASPSRFQLLLQPTGLDAVVNFISATNNQITLDGLIGGAPGAIPTRIVLTQSL